MTDDRPEITAPSPSPRLGCEAEAGRRDAESEISMAGSKGSRKPINIGIRLRHPTNNALRKKTHHDSGECHHVLTNPTSKSPAIASPKKKMTAPTAWMNRLSAMSSFTHACCACRGADRKSPRANLQHGSAMCLPCGIEKEDKFGRCS